MKHKILLILFLAFIPIAKMVADTQNVTVGGINYEIDTGNKTASVISKLSGSKYSGTVIIPSTFVYDEATYRVTSIGEYAFSDCQGLTSVTIGNNVTTIKGGAFYGCSNLNYIFIGSGVTEIQLYDENDSFTFSGCSNLSSIFVASGNTTYDSRNNCNAIIEKSTNKLILGGKETVIPNTVKSIGDEAFRYKIGLTSITIPSSVTSIGKEAFAVCDDLTSVIFDDGAINIEDEAFWNCRNLATVSFGNNLRSIGYCAFNGCSMLTSISIPASVYRIENGAFSDCSYLTSIQVDPDNTTYDSRDNCNAIIETATNKLIAGCFDTTIPNSVTGIAPKAFNGCTRLTSIEIPNSVKGFIDGAFMDCTGLTSVIVGNGVDGIIDGAFYDCTKLKTVVLGRNVKVISDNYGDWLEPFFGCPIFSLTILNPTPPSFGCNTIPGHEVRVPADAVSAYRSDEYWEGYNIVGIPPGIQFADSKVKELCVDNWDTNHDGELSMDEAAAVTDLGDVFKENSEIASFDELQYFTGLTSLAGTFERCTGLTSIVIPSAVESINSWSDMDALERVQVDEQNPWFDSRNGCNAVIETATNTLVVGCKTTVIPNDVIAIGDNAFGGRWGMEAIDIPSSVTTISIHAFPYCIGLTHIELPASVTSIGEEAFVACFGLNSVTVAWDNPLAVPDNIFKDVALENATLYVPVGTMAAYAAADVWKDFGNIVENTNINFADAGVKALCVENWDTNHDGELSMDEAAAVTDLGDVFKENNEITSFDELQYFTGLTSIGTDAFYDCSGLTSVIIPNSVKSIGLRTFYGCSSLTSIDIPNSVMSINNGAFSYCSGLTSIIIPNNVTNIGGLAFGFCSNLTSVTIPNSVTSIGDWAFYNCSNLATVTVEWEYPLDVSSHIPFDGMSGVSVAQATLYVPAGTMAAYSAAQVWKDFGNIVEMSAPSPAIDFADSKVKEICVANWDTDHDGELSIAEAAAVTDLGDVFKENSEITSFDELQYFTGLTSISFSDCNNLKSVVIPYAVESIAGWEFANCVGLEHIKVVEENPWLDSRNNCNAIIETATDKLVVGCESTIIPDDVTAIGAWAFWGRWGMQSMAIPSSVTTIGNHAFAWCVGLTHIELPASVTSIEEEAFWSCGALASVTVEWENPLAVPENIFREVPVKKVVLHIPEGTKAAYKAADVWKEFFMDGDDWDTWVAELLLRELITRLESAGGYELDEAKATADNYNATKEELEGCIAQLQQQIKDRCANADESELPVDATGLINNPSFTFDTNSYWQGDTPQFQSFNDAEFFQTSFDIHQQLTGLPNGRYLLKVKGFHRPGSNEDVFNDYQQGIDNASAQLYANEESVTFNNQAAFAQNELVEGTGFEVGGTHQYVPNTMYDAYIWFRNGYYENELPITVIDGTMNLGIRLDESVNGGWVIFDDFRLEYLGKDPNRLYADEAAAPLKMYRYKTANLDLHLDNEETLVAFEFNLRLPEGVSIALDEDGYPDAVLNEARSDRHNLEVEERSDGSYHFLCYSNSNNAFKGDNGELLSIKLVSDEDMEPGAYQGLLSSIKFVDADENSLLMPELSFDIEVVDITMGDVNDDGDIDVLDVVAMVNYIMEKPSANFIFAAADHNEDGLVDVVDLVKEVRLVMSQAANAPSTSFDQLSGGLSLVAGQDGAVTLNINDAASYVASQFLVTLSHGQHLADVTTDKRHMVSFEQVSDNQYVVVSYSNTNACYASNTAALTLHVEGGGQVNVEDATFVSDNKERVSFQNVNSEHTDGIRYASYDFTTPADIYSTSGALLKKNATSADGLKAGVYVVNGNKYLKK